MLLALTGHQSGDSARSCDRQVPGIAATTPGLSGADLKNLVNEAALLAARREQNELRHKDFVDALEKIVLGPERPLLLSPEDRERIAYHETARIIGVRRMLRAFVDEIRGLGWR